MTSLVRRLVTRGALVPALDPVVRDAMLAIARARRRDHAPSRDNADALYRRHGSVRPLLLGHRGAMARAPENTLGAFRAALDDGADGVELDTQLSADGVAIVLHDDTLDRTTALTGKPIRHAADELDAIDAGSWFTGWRAFEKVPRLVEALDAVGRDNVVNVELKGPTPFHLGLERRVLDVVRDRCHPAALGPGGVIVSSFHPAQLLAIRTLAPSVPIGLLVSARSVLPLRTGWAAAALLPDAIHPPASLVDGGFVAAAHQAGMRVNVWSIRDVDDAARLLELGVDGLIVDDVAPVAALFRERGYSTSVSR